MSESPLDATLTTNAYQTVQVGDSDIQGFRTARSALLDMVDFRGARVLDLGSNLGEISRGARERGALLVDGYEYDSYFVELAGAINVLRDATRTSFFRRDITKPEIYRERFDIVIAFSVFVYIRDLLDTIAAITDGVLLVETHRLDGNLESTYIEPISRHFASHRILGQTEWAASQESADERAVIAFAKSDGDLMRYVKDGVPHLANG
jgi:SAM-dependent methyltransferase